jgi:uncharacterized membrane protein YfcA
MDLVVIALSALLASGVTLFSGFGLGTVLTPVFALFFPVPLAIAATAVVHFANNLFKFWLMARYADWRVVLRFALPATATAMLGAALLATLEQLPALMTWEFAGRTHEITPVKGAIGVLIVVFAVLELLPGFHRLEFSPRWLPVGGALSGFFGGLSGNQGALRSAFLLRAGLSKEAFVATGIVSAVIIDAARLLVYGAAFLGAHRSASEQVAPAVATATVAAFAGAMIGKELLEKVTLRAVQLTVACLMLAIGLLLVSGLI